MARASNTGIKNENISPNAGIESYKLALGYASEAAFLAAKKLKNAGATSTTAAEGDCFFHTGANQLMVHDGTQWVPQGVSGRNVFIDFTKTHSVSVKAAGGGAAVATDNAVNQWLVEGQVLECSNTGQNDDISPTRTADGYVIPNDNTDNDGIELGFGVSAFGKQAFTVGTDAFKLEVKLKIPDVSDYDVCAIGFRKAAAIADVTAASGATSLATAYSDLAVLNVNAGDIYSITRLNSGTAVATDLSVTDVVDGGTPTLGVFVDADGAVTYEVDGAAPSNAVAVTLDTGDVMVPCLIFTKGATSSDTPVILQTLSCGLQ